MKKISTLLCLLSLAGAANLMAEKNYSNIPSLSVYKTGFNISALDDPSDTSSRYITQDEFNGAVPIDINLYQTLIIPLKVTINSNVFNADSAHCYNLEFDTNMLRVTSESSIIIGNNIVINILIYSTSLAVGKTTLTFDCKQNGIALTKQFVINVRDSQE